MKYAIAILTLCIVAGCSKHESAASSDSLLTTPMQPQPASEYHDSASGLIIDSFMVQQQQDIQKLNGIDPVRVVQIYDAFQPLRTESTTSAQIDSFLRSQKITADQLKADLAEGDRLGWGKAIEHK